MRKMHSQLGIFFQGQQIKDVQRSLHGNKDLFIKQEHDRWFADSGDKTRLLKYNLSNKSIVFLGLKKHL